ncbi:hypothetical protein GMORB2_0464 [Geosmithia morbida]|uniref:Coupling of ubiquitin conjugation to ER degradation protein 1 n=1 Tax=Geosmithia morbida TaxID=1094350 RepID=A0A9P4Z3E7_9HYPO|nr:uncharacterized protein GMORB2_0464 [Geosmithia morbida]KAF4126727.1 hypothetical protein GMORB2_0464 [Geosmithia morbida]
MSDDQISLPYFLAILVGIGLLVRYLFFGSSSPSSSSSSSRRPSSESVLRAREVAVERIQQMFPQAERRSILWDLQRNGMNIQNTIERILAGRLETPPITFQPPLPPGHATTSTTTTTRQQADRPAQPDLITRYNLSGKLGTAEVGSGAHGDGGGDDKKGKGWSTNRDERQATLQRRRDEMILAARRKMEARMKAEGKTA